MGTKMKESGIPWIGMIPDNWEVKRLKEVFVECKEKSLDGAGELLSLSQYTGVQQKKDTDKAGTHESETYEGYNVVHKGQLVMNIMLAWNGSYAISDYDGIISPAYCVFDFRIDCAKQYFHYLLRTNGYPSAFKTLSRGIIDSRLRLYPEQFYTFPTIFPPLPTQQRIADFLDRKCAEIDDLAALQETMIAELKRYKQSLITETVTKGLNPNAQMKDSGVEWIGEIPEGWKIRRLKFVANRRNEKADDSTLKYIGLEHIVGFSKEMVETENVYDNEGANMCYDRDVIFGKLRPYLGKAKVIEDTCCCSSEFLVLCNVHCPDYLRYLILSGWFIEIVNASTYGTKMPRANADFIMNMLIPVPHTNEQQQIADYLDRKCAEIDELIAIKQQKIEALKEYKKSVIYEYVTGKKEVEK